MKNTMRYMILTAAACCAVASAAPITVVNGDFSSPTAKITDGYAAVVGWNNTGGNYTDTGVEAAPGAEVAFAKGSDDGAYQIFDHAMVEGEAYILTWDSSLVGLATNETVALLSAATTNDAFGSTTTLTNYVGAAGAGQTLSYTATAADAGNYIGISFDNTSIEGESWIEWDNFAVSAVIGPEPPYWTLDPIQGDDGMVSNAYSGTLEGLAFDPNSDPITYSLVGPSTWLLVETNGVLSGTPGGGHEGSNTFTVAATTVDGTTNATLNIYVEAQFIAPPIVLVDNTTANGSFEVPDAGKIIFSTGTIPFWSNWAEQDTADDDTGTDAASGGTQNGLDGARVAFLQPGGAIANMATNAPHTIQAGDVIVYSVWNSLVGRDPATISLVYDDAGTLTQIPATDVTAADGTKAEGEFTVQAGDAWIGSTLGVGIVSGGNWPEIDQVFLGVTPKPFDPVTDLVITGPVSGGTQMVLTWTSDLNGTYGVQTNANLIITDDWKDWMSGIDGTGGTLSVTNDIGPAQTFYRVITE